jgi:hypothetical protein
MQKKLNFLSVVLFFVGSGLCGCDGSGRDVRVDGSIVGERGDGGFGRPTTENPCVYRTGCTEVVTMGYGTFNVFSCGWDPATDTCYVTPWCEPSVASVKTNVSYDPCDGATMSCSVRDADPLTGIPYPIQQRPRSASCSAGGTYTYKAGTLMVWGVSAQGSQYSSGGLADDGYLCVPSTHDVVVNC